MISEKAADSCMLVAVLLVMTAGGAVLMAAVGAYAVGSWRAWRKVRRKP